MEWVTFEILERQDPRLPPQPEFCLDLYSLQRLSMNTNRMIDSISSIPDSTSLHDIKVGELLKEYLGHMRQFQGKVLSGGNRMGSSQRYYLGVT